MSGYTHEPWHVALGSDVGSRTYVRAGPGLDEKAVAEVMARVGEQMGNARRIVAAVNACKGIPTETLEDLLKGEVDFGRDWAKVLARLDEAERLLRALVETRIRAGQCLECREVIEAGAPRDAQIVHGDGCIVGNAIVFLEGSKS